MLPNVLLQEAEQGREAVVSARRMLHQSAETGFDLTNTMAFVKKELTDRAFFTFSGGEKAMSMYVPLFSAAAAKSPAASCRGTPARPDSQTPQDFPIR